MQQQTLRVLTWLSCGAFLFSACVKKDPPASLAIQIAGGDQALKVGSKYILEAQLTGEGAERAGITWELTQAPEGNQAKLTNDNGNNTELTPNALGVYVVRATASLDDLPASVHEVRLTVDQDPAA